MKPQTVIKARNDQVLVEPHAPVEKSKGGVILTSSQESLLVGTVISKGDKVENLHEGDVVLYESSGYSVHPYEDYIIMGDGNILAVLEVGYSEP